MKKDKLLYALIILLLIINISGLLFMLLPKHPNEEFDRMIINELDLDDRQIEQFDNLKEEHHRQILEIDRQMGPVFEEYFSLLTHPEDTHKKDSLEKILSGAYQEKIRVTYKHFNKLKGICSAEQQKHMDRIIPKLMHVISPQKKSGPPRRN